jgi:hypothetical protein
VSGLCRRRLPAGVAVLLVVGGIVVAVADLFAGRAASGSDVNDNAAPTALASVERRSLLSQTTQVNGRLGYAGSWTVAVPAAIPQSDLRQAQQQLASARAALSAAETIAAADRQALADAKATLRAAQLKESSDCGGADGGGAGNAGSGSGSGDGNCATAMQAVSRDQVAVTSARQKVAADTAQLTGDRSTLASAQQAAADAQAAAASYGSSASFTMLPTPGKVIRRGQPLYAVNGQPTLLLYGGTPAWRALVPGMSPGRDVTELNANLRALGYDARSGDNFTSLTEEAIAELQRAHGLTATGTLALGAVAFEPRAVRVTTVTPTVGGSVQPGPVMTVSSTRQDVAIELDAAQQSEVKVGDRVTVTLPDDSTTPGAVSSVGKVATTPASAQSSGGPGGGASGGDASGPTIEVDVRLLHASAAGTLDQAPVDVSITTASVSDVLAVPVNALVALAGGGYALEHVEADGTHRLVAATPGLFDDAAGMVQLSGSGVAAGQRVVVPASS